MKQLNPLYTIFLLVALLFFVLFKLMNAKAALLSEQNSWYETQETLTSLVDYRQTWGNQKRTSDKLTSILKSPLLYDAKIIRDETQGMIELHSYSLDSKAANYLINRLLNETFTIRSIKILRLGSDRASLHVEIKL